jgi:peptide chain release factor subunit 3
VDGILLEGEEVEKCFPGDNVMIRVKGVDEDDLHSGFVLVDPKRPIPITTIFTAQILLLECRNIISAGYSCVLHIHALAEECTFKALLCTLDKKTGEVLKKNPPCVKGGDTVLVRIETQQPIAVESFKVFGKMGRFMLRDEGKTVAVGVITKIFPLTEK